MSSWTYPINGEVHYFTRGNDQPSYSVQGVMRAMSLFVDKLPAYASVEAAMVYPERKGWSGMLAVYYDNPMEAAA